ncbi:MAG: TonB-dependent receptor [Candidatus Solibacter sp.]|nr:TonB-dependent receptor [Candidatus Solibacter sp.]
MRTVLFVGRLACTAVLAALEVRGQNGLAEASLEQLLDIQVTTVSKKEQKLARTAAAVFVLGAEEIRRSGVLTLPDLLRLVPGVQVAQIDANAWAISIRGFNSLISNKVLVLVDGRVVYNATFSGVYWDQVDVPVEDIERIEVIRGPGATVWGANAVNGVINVITRPAKATPGGLATVVVGSGPAAQGTLRYGGPAGTHGAFRTFAKYSRFADQKLADGHTGADGWSRMHGGFRADWELGRRDGLTVQGDWFANRGSQTRSTSYLRSLAGLVFVEDLSINGGNLLARWKHTSSGGAETSMQAYYDTYRRVDLGTRETSDTGDLDVQHHFVPFGAHDIVAGGGFRAVRSTVRPGGAVSLAQAERTDPLYSAFVQDEFRLAPQLWLTVGSKVEHNSYTGFEFEPSARLAWTPGSRHALWAAGSRAIRQPDRVENGVRMELATTPLGANTVLDVRVSGNPTFRSEELLDFEAGYRAQWTQNLSLDATAYASFYSRLATLQPQAPRFTGETSPVRIEQQMLYGNMASARNYGGEVSLNWTINGRWRMAASYALRRLNPSLPPGSSDLTYSDATPRNQIGLRSEVNLWRNLEWDQTLEWVQQLRNGRAPGYVRADSRLGWKFGEVTQLSIVGQNLMRSRCAEFGGSGWLINTMTARKVFGRISWTF